MAFCCSCFKASNFLCKGICLRLLPSADAILSPRTINLFCLLTTSSCLSFSSAFEKSIVGIRICLSTFVPLAIYPPRNISPYRDASHSPCTEPNIACIIDGILAISRNTNKAITCSTS